MGFPEFLGTKRDVSFCHARAGGVSFSQDRKYRGAETRVRIGDRNTLREYVTVHAATDAGNETRIGDGNLIMAYVHVAHDCSIGDDVVIANAVTMGGIVRDAGLTVEKFRALL